MKTKMRPYFEEHRSGLLAYSAAVPTPLGKTSQDWDEIANADDNLLDFNAYYTRDIINIFKHVLEYISFTLSTFVN